MTFIHSFSKHVLLIYFVLGTGISVRDSEPTRLEAAQSPRTCLPCWEKQTKVSKSNIPAYDKWYERKKSGCQDKTICGQGVSARMRFLKNRHGSGARGSAVWEPDGTGKQALRREEAWGAWARESSPGFCRCRPGRE